MGVLIRRGEDGVLLEHWPLQGRGGAGEIPVGAQWTVTGEVAAKNKVGRK
jgi:hypothetical protein